MSKKVGCSLWSFLVATSIVLLSSFVLSEIFAADSFGNIAELRRVSTVEGANQAVRNVELMEGPWSLTHSWKCSRGVVLWRIVRCLN